MAIQIFDEFLNEFEQPITQFVSNSVQNLAAAIDTPLRIAVTLWVVLYGIAIIRGAFASRSWASPGRSSGCVRHRGARDQRSTFQTYVTDLFFKSLPKEIGNAIAGSGLNTSSGAPFDKLLNKGIRGRHQDLRAIRPDQYRARADCGDPDGLHGRLGLLAVRRHALCQHRLGS